MDSYYDNKVKIRDIFFAVKGKDCCSNIDNEDKRSKKKFAGKCFHCGKVGHKEADCWAKHGKPGERVNTAREHEDEEESDDEAVLISMGEVIDFAGITVTEDPSDKNEVTDGSNIECNDPQDNVEKK